MKNKINKLVAVLKAIEKDEIKIPVELVYLSIVFLGYKIPEVAAYFKITESKVQSALCFSGVEFKNNSVFNAKMKKVARVYNIDNVLKLVA